MAITSPVMPAIQAQSRTTVTRSRSPEQEKRVIDDENYRRSPKNWLEQIRVLMKEGQAARAQTEYDLFRKAFPDYEPDFTLDSAPK